MIWRNQDWFWFTGILITVIICISAFRLSDNQTVVDIFAFIASGVSIALAVTAMYTSFRQNSDNADISQRMSETLARMDEKINMLDNKVSNLDPKVYIENERNVLIDDLKKIVDNDGLSEEIEKKVNEKFNNLNIELQGAINKNKYNFQSARKKMHEKAIRILKNNKNMTYRDLTSALAITESMNLSLAETIVDDLIMNNYIYEGEKNNLHIKKASQ